MFEFFNPRPDLKKGEGGSREEEDSDWDIYGHDEAHPYQAASAEDISGFKDEIEDKIVEKAIGLGITTREELEKMADLSGLDLGYFEGLEQEDLTRKDAPAWTRRDLEIMRDNVEEALAECQRSGKGLKLEPKADALKKITDYLEKHHHTINMGQLFLLAFSYDSNVIQDLADKGLDIKVGHYNVPLGTMINSSEITEKMNDFGPQDADHHHFGQYSYSDRNMFEDSGTRFSFEVFRGLSPAEDNDTARGVGRLLEEEEYIQRIYLMPLEVDEKRLDKFNEDLRNDVGISLMAGDNGCSFEEFSKNRDKIAHYLATDLGVEEGKIAENIDGFIGYEVSDVSLVEFDDFRIDPDAESSENFKALKSYEKVLLSGEGHEQFRTQFLGMLEDSGYDIDEVKELAATHPEEVVRIIMDVMARNIDSYVGKDNGQEWNERYEDSNVAALEILQGGKANCWGWMTVCIDAKVVLEAEGVPNLDKIAMFPAYSTHAEHVWVAMATESRKDEVSCTCVDPTRDGRGGNNAIDMKDWHSYGVSKYDTIMAAVRDVQDLHKVQGAIEAMQYDPYFGEDKLEKIGVAGDEASTADAGKRMLDRVMVRINELKAERGIGEV